MHKTFRPFYHGVVKKNREIILRRKMFQTSSNLKGNDEDEVLVSTRKVSCEIPWVGKKQSSSVKTTQLL